MSSEPAADDAEQKREQQQGLLQITRTLEAGVDTLAAQLESFDTEINAKIDRLFQVLKE